jgi:hypothetical protein
MAETSLAITTEYVRCFLALMGKDIAWPQSVLQKLTALPLDRLDVTHVITHGQVVNSEKESADGTVFIISGETCDELAIRVTFWADPNQMSLRIIDVDID